MRLMTPIGASAALCSALCLALGGPAAAFPQSCNGGGGGNAPEAPSEPPTPGPNGYGPSTPGVNPFAPGARLIPFTPGAEHEPGVDPTGWEWWWDHNRDALMRFDRASRVPATPTGDDIDVSTRLRRELVHERVTPALVAALEGSRDPRVVRAALLSLGRVGEDPRADVEERVAVTPLLAARLTHSSRSISEAAILALGLVASPAATALLAAIALDEQVGREALDTTRVDVRRRAFACYGLGLAARRAGRPELARFAAHNLVRVFDDLEKRFEDLQVAAVLGLSLLPAERGACDVDAIVARLSALLASPRGPELARIHAPTALARLAPATSAEGRSAIVALLLARLAPQAREDEQVRRSVVLALGMLGDADDGEQDAEIRRVLMGLLAKGEPLERRFAAVALGQIGGRAGQGEAPLSASTDVARELSRVLARGRDGQRQWAGLALGILGRSLRGEGKLLEKSAADALFHATTTAKSSATSAAYGLGASLLEDRRVAPALRERFTETGQGVHRAHLSLALGFLGERESTGDLAREMHDAMFDPERYEYAAVGRALLRDRELVPELVATLAKAGSWAETDGCARALAWVGDATVVDPLLATLADPRSPAAGRSALVRALGWIGDAHGRPWEDPLGAGINYTSAPPTLSDPTGTGLLDLL